MAERWDAEYDVVIAGAGAAGLEAALEASAAGATAVVFEKQSRLWESSTAIAVGRVAFAGTEIQRRHGIEDSGELLYRDIMATGKNRSDPALVEAYVAHQLDTWRQLGTLGVEWAATVNAVAGMSVPRGHLTDALDLVRRLKRAADASAVPVFFATPVTGLVSDSHNVEGVTVRERSGVTTRIRARRGVVLASGGFARDTERLRAIDPRFGDVLATAGAGHTGDALRMAEALGADTRDMEFVQPSFELHAAGSTSDDILVLFYQGAIIVNTRGERFVDESISYKELGMAALDQPGRTGFQVFDARVFDKAVAAQAASGMSSPITLDPARIRLLARGDTIEALADAMGVPRRSLARTIERYNEAIATGGDDECGRRTLAGYYGKPVPLDTPPFYAYATIGHLLATYAGVSVDAGMRVLRGGRPMPGLFAAGEAIGGFHGASYHSGTALGKALVFGRIAGRSAAMRGAGDS